MVPSVYIDAHIHRGIWVSADFPFHLLENKSKDGYSTDMVFSRAGSVDQDAPLTYLGITAHKLDDGNDMVWDFKAGRDGGVSEE